MTVELGIASNVIGLSTDEARVNTRSSYDFAYWASTFVSTGVPEDYFDLGPETDGTSLVSWAASQVGINFTADFQTANTILSEGAITVAEALRIRGAVLVCTRRISVCMGLTDVVDVVDGRYFQYKVRFTPQNALTCINNWQYGALLPGLVY